MSLFRRTIARCFLLICILVWPVHLSAQAETPALRIAVLKFGTVNWAMDVIKHHKLDTRNGFELEVVGLASKNATTVAFLARDVDAIVTDWFWVLRQRAEGNDVVQFPYSASLGAVMVAADGGIASLDDLKGKRIGIAGGPIDKSWLLLRAFVLASDGSDLAKAASPVYAAPPLLNEQLIAGRVDAVLNFWPFAARLEGAGYRRIAGVSELMQGLDMGVAAPLVGFTFSRRLAEDKPALVAGFMKAVRAANDMLDADDVEWDRIRPLMKAKNDDEFAALKTRYKEGILTSWTREQKHAAAQLFEMLRRIGGEKLTGAGTRFDPAMFWPAED